jgi:hypothetical protein
MKRQSSIQAFFVKKKRVSSEIEEQTSFEITPSPSTCATSTGSATEINEQTSFEPTPSSSNCTTSTGSVVEIKDHTGEIEHNLNESNHTLLVHNIKDIGHYCSSTSFSLPNEEKISIIENCWKPQRSYEFPKVENNRSFQYKWLEDFKWLAYSEAKEGALCKYCVFFSHNTGGKGNHQSLGVLVSNPLTTKLKKARQVFMQHENKQYHKTAMLMAEDVKSLVHGKTESVINSINMQRKMNVQENKNRIIPIIQTIRFCGRQQIALRGHRDGGRVDLDEPIQNDGNFRSLLRYRANYGDNNLKTQLETGGGKTMYTSSVIQNEIIGIFGSQIQSKIVSNVRKSVFYSVLADETTDISQIEQFSLCVRYVDEELFKIREDFLAFVPVYDVTGQGLANTLMSSLTSLGLDLNNLRGQGYDGASAMSGQFRGVQAFISEKVPSAIYTHCSSHSLNLCLSDASKIPMIRNCMGVISEVCSFFHKSAKRTAILKSSISECCPEMNRKKLISLCETRWVQRHDSVIMFKEALEPIITALSTIEEESTAEASVKAHTLIASVTSFQFVACLFILNNLLSLTIRLSEMLQKKDIDLAQANKQISNVLELVKEMRSKAEETFQALFSELKVSTDKLGIKEETPRTCRKQTNRCNTPYTNVEEYYRRVVYIPYLDDFCCSLQERFKNHREVIDSLQNVLPEHCIKTEFSSLEPALTFYEKDLSFRDEVRSEFLLWKQKWNREEKESLPKTAISALEKCDKDYFPNMFNILKLLAVLPVSVASAERSFSSLRRLKTYLRNTTSENRLNGLALLSIHRDITITDEEVLKQFSLKSRNLDFVL